MCFPALPHGGGDQFLQGGEMDVGKALDIEAAFAGGVFTEFRKKVFLPIVAKHQIENDVLFARRKRDEHPIGFLATGIDPAMVAVADDAGSPHYWLFFCGCLHDGGNGFAILADLLVLQGGEEISGEFVRFFGFRLGQVCSQLRRTATI